MPRHLFLLPVILLPTTTRPPSSSSATFSTGEGASTPPPPLRRRRNKQQGRPSSSDREADADLLFGMDLHHAFFPVHIHCRPPIPVSSSSPGSAATHLQIAVVASFIRIARHHRPLAGSCPWTSSRGSTSSVAHVRRQPAVPLPWIGSPSASFRFKRHQQHGSAVPVNRARLLFSSGSFGPAGS